MLKKEDEKKHVDNLKNKPNNRSEDLPHICEDVSRLLSLKSYVCYRNIYVRKCSIFTNLCQFQPQFYQLFQLHTTSLTSTLYTLFSNKVGNLNQENINGD